jgi:hypothetical protein
MNEYFKPFFNPWHYGLKDYKDLWAWKHTIKNWFYENPRAFFKWVKYFFQRGSRGWADCDWWSMNSYLCEVIIPMLKELKENKHGCPCGLDENFEEAEKKWNASLDEMIESFEAAKRVLENDYCSEEWDKIFSDKIFDKEKMLDQIPSKDTHKVAIKSMKLSKADQKIFDKKAKVFIKYFFSLWD